MVLRPTPRQAARVSLAALLQGAGAAALLLYLQLPDVRSLATGFPASTSYMRLRAEESGPGWNPRYDPVPLSEIAPELVRAVWVAEDASFYQHRGIDWYELRQAVREAWEERRPPRGASTITQQLARNLYLAPSRSLARKAEELFIARRLEHALSKRRILELYLNVAEWGPGIFGAEAAARTYYGTSARDLDLRRAAELAATLPRPLSLNPARASEQLDRRTDLILRRLAALGLRPEPTPAPAGDVPVDSTAPHPPP